MKEHLLSFQEQNLRHRFLREKALRQSTKMDRCHTNKKPLMGVVVNCMNLNIRKDPTQASRSLGIIGSDTVVKVCNDESVSGFYKVKTVDGISGYCMSEFIKLC